jgi:hypothetical protein
MKRGVVIRVVTVAFFGNGSLSSSPQAEEPPKSGTDVGAKEKKIAVNDKKTTSRPIHRHFIALTSCSFVMFQMNRFGFTLAHQMS